MMQEKQYMTIWRIFNPSKYQWCLYSVLLYNEPSNVVLGKDFIRQNMCQCQQIFLFLYFYFAVIYPLKVIR